MEANNKLTVTSHDHGHETYYDEKTDTWKHKESRFERSTLKQDKWGNKIYYDKKDHEWKYVTSQKMVSRPCKRCGEFPTKEGYDYCLGFLGDKVTSACCGHGKEQGFILLQDGRLFKEVKTWKDTK